MFKITKKSIAVLMSVFFLISLIPVSSFADDATAISTYFGENATQSIRTWNGYNHITYSQESATPIGGREDTSSVYTVGAIPEGITVKHTSGHKWTPDATQNYTFEMSVYFDGTAYPAVNTLYDDELPVSLLMKVGQDGYVYYNNNGTTTKSDVKLASEAWHSLVIEYQTSRGRFAIYVNDEKITENTTYYNSTQTDELWIGVASHSANGRVAYDDFKAYYGAYVPDANSTIITNDTDYLKFETEKETIAYNPDVYTTPASLAEAIKDATSSKYVKIFEDATLSTEASILSDENVAQFTSPNGKTVVQWKIRAINTDANLISNAFGYDRDGNAMAVYKDSRNSNITWSETTGGLGGKAESDKSFVFSASEIPAGAANKSAGVKYASLDWTKDYVFEMNILVDGADATVNFQYEDNGYEIVKLLSDGTVVYRKNDTYVEYPTKFETGKWHRLVIWFDGASDNGNPRRRHSIYLDGEKLTEDGKYMSNAAALIMPGINAATSSEGIVAIDDFKAYYSDNDYTPNTADMVVTENTSALTFDTMSKTLTYNPYVYADLASLIQGIEDATQSKYTAVFADSDLSVKADELTEDCTLVFTSPNGKSYAYYTLAAMSDNEAVMKAVSLSSDSVLVHVTADSVAALSHNTDSDYYLNSEAFIEALSSAEGYTLEYVDADKNELGTREEIQDDETVLVPVVDPSVTDGYVKATKGDNVFYIPVVTRASDNTDFEKSPAGTSVVWKNDYSSYLSATTEPTESIGGKPASDIDCVISATSEIPEGTMVKTTGVKYASLPLIPTTFEMNVFIDGDAEFAVNIQYREDMYNVLRIKPDGTIVYTYKNFGNIMTSPFKAESGKWHKVAITYDVQRTRCHIYVDGNLITDTTPPLTAKTIMIGAGSGTKNGKVAIADFVNYYGFYNYIDVVRAEGGKITATADDDIINGNCVFALAEYDGGKMVAISPNWENAQATLDYNPDHTYKTFLWNSENAAPVAKAVYYR